MRARARRLECKMEEDQVRRMLRYLTKYISKVEMVNACVSATCSPSVRQGRADDTGTFYLPSVWFLPSHRGETALRNPNSTMWVDIS